MTKAHSYAVRFATGLMDPKAKAFTQLLDTMDHTRGELLLRQHAPFPDTEEGRLNREGLHRLIDAWLDGVPFDG